MPNDVRPRKEAPVAAVVTHVAVIAHGKVAVRGHNDIVAFEMRTKFLLPLLISHTVHFGRWDRGEVVAIRVEIRLLWANVGLIRFFALAETVPSRKIIP